MKSRAWVVFLLLTAGASAQFGSSMNISTVRVRVAFANGLCQLAIHVRLAGHKGPAAEQIANGQCVAEFRDVPSGTYHLVVSSATFGEVDGGDVVLDTGSAEEFEVTVQVADDSTHMARVPGNALVSASDLAVPAKAQKEFIKANELIAKRNFPQAVERLNKAISIYPGFAEAHNNLGAIYAQMGDLGREREELQKAISANPHFAPAYLNLGRLELTGGNLASAETALQHAFETDSADALTVVLLSYANFMNHHFDRAIEMSRRAHALPAPHAFAHEMAARAYDQKGDETSAAAELEQFLAEEPAGQRADIARKQLAAVRQALAGAGTHAVSSALPH